MTLFSPLVNLAQSQLNVFALYQAAGLGCSVRAVQRRVESDGWERLYRGVYGIPASEATYMRTLMAAQLAVGSGALVDGRAAAHAYGMTEARPRPVEILRTGAAASTLHHGIKIRRAKLWLPNDSRFLGRLDLVGPLDALRHMAAYGAGSAELAEVAAMGIQLNLFALVEVKRAVAGMGGQRGVKALRRVVDILDADGKTDSKFERDVRSQVKAWGFTPHPGTLPIKVRGGRTVYLDIPFLPEMVFIDAEGFGFHSSPTAHRNDRVRANDVINTDWQPVYLTKREFRETPARFHQQLATALTHRRSRPPSVGLAT